VTTLLAPYADGIPIVRDNNDRTQKFAVPATNQRVHNLASRGIEKWNGAAWERLFDEVGVSVQTVFRVTDPPYGAKGDGSTNDITAFNGALTDASAVGGVALVPDPVPGQGYLLGAILTIPANTALVGSNKHSTRLIHGYNGTMVDLGSGARLENLWFDGNGATFTGRGIFIGVGNGFQTVRSCRIIDFADYCVDFSHEAAGSQSHWEDLVAYQLVGTSVGQEAIIIRGTLTALANPRTFIGLRTVGKAAIDLGPCNNLFLVGCRLDGVLWSDDSRGVTITGGRIGSTIAGMTVKGANHSVTGVNIGPQVTIAAGTTHTKFKGNSYNNPPFIDLAMSATNSLEDQKEIVDFPFIAFAASDTTPDVSQGKFFQCANASPTTITYFDGGVDGQCIRIRLDLNTAITDASSFIRLADRASIPVGILGSNDFIEFIRISGIWFETRRSRGVPVANAIIAKSGDYTLTAADRTVLVSASGAARTMTLPAAAGHFGRIYTIKKTDGSANTVTIDGNASETIDGATTKVLTAQYEVVTIQCDGANWHIIG